MEIHPAVVTPLDEHMGLDIARSLGKRGIPVFGIDPDPQAAGRVSKYCTLLVCPDPKDSPEEYIQYLLEWGQTQRKKPVLYPLNDEVAQICSLHRDRLLKYYEFVMPEHSVMDRMSSKQGLASAAVEYGIPAPRTVTPGSLHEVKEIAKQLSYPVILKPIESAYWHNPEIASLLRKGTFSGRTKVVLCHTESELMQMYQHIAVHDSRMIIQESIPGPDENLSYISFYLNRQSQPLAIFAGRKLRILPVGFGSASYVKSYTDPELERVALSLLSCAQYQGLGGLEFKKDSRDGRYKLIEFNTRFGLWDGLAVHCGIDTPYIAYLDALKMPVEPQRTYRNNVIWVDWQKDLRAFFMYRRLGKLSFSEWIRSLRGEKMWAVYSGDDWRPGVLFTYNLLLLLLKRLVTQKKLAK